jgi:cysteinyl-tRNA synthetase
MKDYGKLSNRTLDEMMAGARVEVAPYKRDPMDFVLWKPSKAGEPGWPSPLGIKTPGRPGWHIECSAMSWKHLGETFDIHGGGIDLVFPHHENELAQSRCAFHSKVMANVWMHNGFLQVEGEKMSKSLGNFITIRDLLTGWKGHKWSGQVIRLAMLGTHYRQPMNWTATALEESEKTHADWSEFCASAPINIPPSPKVVASLSDDLNTPAAIAELHALRKKGDAATLRGSLSFMGIGIAIKLSVEEKIKTRLEAKVETVSAADVNKEVEKIKNLIDARLTARKAKDFKESDRIRDELTKMGVVLKDNKDGTTTWEVAR